MKRSKLMKGLALSSLLFVMAACANGEAGGNDNGWTSWKYNGKTMSELEDNNNL